MNKDVNHIPALITPWAAVHFMTAVTLYFGFSMFIEQKPYVHIIAVIFHLAYELKDSITNHIGKYRKDFTDIASNITTWTGNGTPYNSMGDNFIFVLGLALSQLVETFMPKTPGYSVQAFAIAVVIEVVVITICIYEDVG